MFLYEGLVVFFFFGAGGKRGVGFYNKIKPIGRMFNPVMSWIDRVCVWKIRYSCVFDSFLKDVYAILALLNNTRRRCLENPKEVSMGLIKVSTAQGVTFSYNHVNKLFTSNCWNKTHYGEHFAFTFCSWGKTP